MDWNAIGAVSEVIAAVAFHLYHQGTMPEELWAAAAQKQPTSTGYSGMPGGLKMNSPTSENASS